MELAYLPTLLVSKDITSAISIPAIWMSVEASLLVVCACLPALRRLILAHTAPRRIAQPLQPKHSVTESAESEVVFRQRPISELTAFNGRIMKKQTWEQMHKRLSSHNVMNLDRYSEPCSLLYGNSTAVPASTTQISLDEYPTDNQDQDMSPKSAAADKI